MGLVYGAEHSYAIGLMLLSDVALAAAVYTAVKMSGLAANGLASRRPSRWAIAPTAGQRVPPTGRVAPNPYWIGLTLVKGGFCRYGTFDRAEI
jgi:hypothetical protein